MLATSPFTLAVEETDRTLRLRLTGDFDRAGVEAVEHALDRLCQAPAPRRVVFDLRGLAFLDLAGLRTILRTDAQARGEAFEVVVDDRTAQPTASSRSPARAAGSASSMSRSAPRDFPQTAEGVACRSSLREWLPEDHLAWFVLEAVDELDLPTTPSEPDA